MIDNKDLPAVDSQRLGEILGGAVVLKDRRDRQTARVLTDAFGASHTPEIALSNGRVWLEHAYKEGLEHGRREERKAWDDKIKRIFE